MDINIPNDFIPAMASSTSANMSGVGVYAVMILGLLLAFYLLDWLVDVIYFKDETTDTTAN
jgi:hypothetical protein